MHQTAHKPMTAKLSRTQAQRSEDMCKRLRAATLRCLIDDGYAKTTVSAICKRAGVSRGAYVHQYASKQSLIQDVSETLLRRSYRRLNQVLLEVVEEADRLQGLLDSIWEEIFSTPQYGAYLELLIASQYDPALATTLQRISLQQIRVLEQAVEHYFEPIGPDSLSGKDLFLLSGWLQGGMASDAHLVDNPGYLRRQLRVWGQLLATQIRPRKGVTQPPTRQNLWCLIPAGTNSY